MTLRGRYSDEVSESREHEEEQDSPRTESDEEHMWEEGDSNPDQTAVRLTNPWTSRRHPKGQSAKRNLNEHVSPEKAALYRDCLLVLVKEMGISSALYSDYAINTNDGYKLVISECGIPSILNELSHNYKMTPWGHAAPKRQSDGTRTTIPRAPDGCPLCPTGAHQMSVSTHLPDRYSKVSWQCNACGVRGKKSSGRWFCEPCNDDYCLTCVPRVAAEATSAAEPAKPDASVNHGSSFVDALAVEMAALTVGATDKPNRSRKPKGGSARMERAGPKALSSLERDSKQRNSKISSQDRIGDLPEEEKYLSHPDIGFEEDDDTDLFIEALIVISQMHRAASTKTGGAKEREKALAHWTAATNPDHSLKMMHERTVRAVMWCIFDRTSDIMDASVLVEWATILQEFTNDTVSEHVLPSHCYVNLGVNSTVSPPVPSEPIKMEPLSCKLVLDIEKDPLYTLCHPSVTSELLMRMTETGFMIAYGLTGQDWDEENVEHSPEELMKRDIDLFLGYMEILVKVVVPRAFPIFEATRTIENESDSRSKRRGRDKKGKPISLLNEICEALYDNLTLLFGTLETALSLVTGVLMEDQTDRLEALLSAVYLWETLCGVTTFDAAAVNEYLAQPNPPPLLNYMSNAAPPKADKSSNKKGPKNRREDKPNASKANSNSESSRDYDGRWLGQNWRFFIDALSYHSKSSRKMNMRRTDTHNPIARLPIVSVDGPCICVRPTAEEVTELLLEATASQPPAAASKLGRRSNGRKGSQAGSNKGNNRRKNNDNEVRCLADMTRYLLSLTDSSHPLPIPVPHKFQELLKLKGDGVRWLVGGDSDSLNGNLKYLMRFPWILEPDQVLAHVNNSLYDLAQNSGDDVSSIVLNRFTDPSVWVESIVQQLSVYDRSLHKKELGITYDDEPGTGPGPIKEFFELTRIMFDLKPLTQKSLRDMVAGKNKPAKNNRTPGKKKNAAAVVVEDTPMKADSSPATVPYEASSAVHVAMSDLLPLFQPAGDCNPTCILPVSIDAICERFPRLLTKNQPPSETISNPAAAIDAAAGGVETVAVAAEPSQDADTASGSAQLPDLPAGAKQSQRGKQKGRRNQVRAGGERAGKLCAAERDLRKKVSDIFEAIGVLLGHSIRNECPMGISLPVIVWALLLGDKPSDFNWIDLCGDDKQLLNSCATILDEPNVEDLQMYFESTLSSYLINKVTDTSAPAAVSVSLEEMPPEPQLQRATSSVAGGLAINHIRRDVELVPNGSEKLVTSKNRKQFVQLYAETAYLNRCTDSIAAMRKGLLKVIPDEYLSLLSPVFIMKQVRGEDDVSVEVLRAAVHYEGGFSPNHRVIRMFWHMLETEFSADDIRQLLLFWTGNSVAPSDGYREDQDEDDRLVIKKMSEWVKRGEGLKAKLPEASTCDKHLYLPVYETVDDMRTAVRAAIVYSCLGYDRL